MTNDHKLRFQASINKNAAFFDAAKSTNDWPSANRAFLSMLHDLDIAIRIAVGARIEADALAAELLVYRPERSDRPAAPLLKDYVYVFTAKASWVCAAVELRKTIIVPAGLGGGYPQDHFVPEKKTLCGKKVNHPVSERFTSGGWPRLHELCPECTVILGQKDCCLATRLRTGGRGHDYRDYF